MSDLVSRVLAAIEQAERSAPSVHRVECRAMDDTYMQTERLECDCGVPAAVLRRSSADLELIALHAQSGSLMWLCELCGPEGQNIDCTYPCDTLRLLARGYGISVEEETT